MIDKILSETKNHLILDCIETWPTDLVNYLEQKLKKYTYTAIVEEYRNEIQEILHHTRFVGFHCTRLRDNEINDIVLNGLNPNIDELLIKRIEFLNKNYTSFYDVSINDYSGLRNKGIFFNLCIRSLKDEYGFNRLFGFWGGESLSNLFDSNPNLQKELAEIGEPYIILASINFLDLHLKYATEKIVKTFIYQKHLLPLNSKVYNDQYIFDFDVQIANKVDSLVVIKQSEELFEFLTNHSTWNDVKNLI